MLKDSPWSTKSCLYWSLGMTGAFRYQAFCGAAALASGDQFFHFSGDFPFASS